MAKIMNSEMKYVLLVLSVIFMGASITYFANHVTDIGLKPYNNISADRMTGEEKFLLDVKQPASVLLLHNAKIASGEIKFELMRDDGQLVTEYKINGDDFLKKIIKLDKGSYQCIITRNVTESRENFRFYFDKRFITQKYLKNDSNTWNKG